MNKFKKNKILLLKTFLLLLLANWSVFSQCQINGNQTMSANSSATFSASVAGANYYWSATGGLSIPVVGGVYQNQGQSVTVNMSNAPGTLYLVTYNANSSSCCSISVNLPAPPPACLIGSGVINDLLCVTNSHPYWRLQMEGFSGQNVTYNWTSQHFTILSGQNTSYIIGNPTDNGYGFTLYCTVTKTCSNGNKLTKTFYYQSRSTNSCEQGTTGVITAPGGGSELEKSTINGSFLLQANEIYAYPNPSVGDISINLGESNYSNSEIVMKVYNQYGIQIGKTQNNSDLKENVFKIEKHNVKDLGLHFVKIYQNGEIVKTLKIFFN